MKVFFTSFAAVIVIAVLAGILMSAVDDSSRTTFQSERGATRL